MGPLEVCSADDDRQHGLAEAVGLLVVAQHVVDGASERALEGVMDELVAVKPLVSAGVVGDDCGAAGLVAAAVAASQELPSSSRLPVAAPLLQR